MARRKGWTPKKRKRARAKAEVSLRRRRLVIEQSRDRTDSGYAGALPLFAYAGQRLELPERLGPALKMRKGKTAVFTPVDEAMAYLGSQLLGIWRLSGMDRLLPEGLLVRALELPRWPSEDTERRFLRRATESTLVGVDRTIQDLIRVEEVQKQTEGWLWVGADITAIESRARQREGARPGYCNGRKRVCFQLPRVCVQGLPWWTDLRPGNDACEEVFDEGLETAERFARENPSRRVGYRVDGGFASKERLRRLQAVRERHGNFHYFLVIPKHNVSPAWWEEAVGSTRSDWRRMNQTTWVKDVGMSRPWAEETGSVHVVAVRRYQQRRTRKGRGPWRWVVTDRVDKEYLIATSARPRAKVGRTIFQWYHTRQGEELSFKDAKQSLPLKRLPARKLLPNRLHVKMVSLAQVKAQLFARHFIYPDRAGPSNGAERTSGFLTRTLREKVFEAGGKNGGAGRDMVAPPI